MLIFVLPSTPQPPFPPLFPALGAQFASPYEFPLRLCGKGPPQTGRVPSPSPLPLAPLQEQMCA